MKIVISNLADGEHFYIFKHPLENINCGDFELNGYLDVNVKLIKAHQQIDVNIDFSGKVSLPCDRCLEKYKEVISGNYGVVYQYKNVSGIQNGEDDENTFYILPETNFIDLLQTLKEYIILAIPMKKVPEEKNGICTYCNKKINDILSIKKEKQDINPVWDILIKNKNK